MAIDLSNDINLVTTPSEVVNFDQNTPTTGGVVFTPNTPLTQDVLYVSSTNASTWIYDGEAYITYTVTPTATTPFYIQDTTIDAGGNKTAPIQHNGYIKAYGFYGSGAGINFLNANYLAAGTVPTARLGSGTADSTTYLRGDNTWQKFNGAISVQSVTSSANVTATSSNDLVDITAQAVGLTLANPTGTFTNGQVLEYRIKDNGSAQTIAFGTSFNAFGSALPTTTTAGKKMLLMVQYDSNTSKFNVLPKIEEQ